MLIKTKTKDLRRMALTDHVKWSITLYNPGGTSGSAARCFRHFHQSPKTSIDG
jgi:hypothetical protein